MPKSYLEVAAKVNKFINSTVAGMNLKIINL